MPLGSNAGERDRARRLTYYGQPPLPATPANYERPWNVDRVLELGTTVPNVKAKVSGTMTASVATKARVSGAWVTPTAVKARVAGAWVTV